MTADPAWLAGLHAACFTTPRPWTTDEFTQLLQAPTCALAHTADGFALARVAADEAELLTIAVLPGARRQGVAHGLLDALETDLQKRGVTRIFLEVSGENAPAIALYRAAGYVQAGQRASYYRHPDGRVEDGLILSKHLA